MASHMVAPKQLTPAEKQVLRTLVSRVARAFYDPKWTVILDALCRVETYRDEQLSKVTKLSSSNVHKICAKLRDEYLIRSAFRYDTKKVEGLSIRRTYYMIDYKRFVDVVKWRIYEMRKRVLADLRGADAAAAATAAASHAQEQENKGYACPSCRRVFDALDACKNVDPHTCQFMCDQCNVPLEENDNSERLRKANDKLARLTEQTQPIIDLLKQTDSMVLPAYTPEMEQRVTRLAEEAEMRESGVEGGEIAVSKDKEGQNEEEIVVFFQDDNPHEKAMEQEKKRTVTGKAIGNDATAPKHTATAAYADTGSDINSETTADGHAMDHDAYYEQYYAQLHGNGYVEGVDDVGDDDDEDDDDAFVEVEPATTTTDEMARKRIRVEEEEKEDGQHHKHDTTSEVVEDAAVAGDDDDDDDDFEVVT
ncbi:hypothetical protein SYNPS1DRAFT_26445 [Syncephalis pseudoplumigaleata]|uniref:HTH TFE/IIEalpha-type domain-containing protein n=1 Tax=Syncephalis pseudoplumigaleata TaxID=1712513 RepID=A0A4P9Z5M0_9FUNG|nr:hypothetical protein SYNPS1DRAFT_26445 [Syncephalis pseudoplumigaleata]|eukprot:RKP27934.1 hypothetical protein SYNPS1DRAFT_26445 [Syncephalis pseudoplumigaleata]